MPAIKKVLKTLPARTQRIMEERYGLFGKQAETLEAIGKREGITRERVRQIENDALERLKTSDEFDTLSPVFGFLDRLFAEYGWVISEQDILHNAVFGSPKMSNVVFFLFELADFAERKKEDGDFRARWYHKKIRGSDVENALKDFVEKIHEHEQAFPESEFFERLGEHLKNAGIDVSGKHALSSYLSIARHLKRNVWNELGHINSPLVKPRGMKDEAYVVLMKTNTPLHFTVIAKKIGDVNTAQVHTQTVHNELIKDNRFVLVGRGVYALRSWGYEPGFVKDVIISILKNGPATEEEIVNQVCQKRLVKKSTVVTNLQNKQHFMVLDNGTYRLLV